MFSRTSSRVETRNAIVTRTVLLLSGAVLAGPACSAGTGPVAGLAEAGTSSAGVGAKCTPSREGDPSFRGSGEQQVSVETGAASCQTGVCLINHFRGRVSCPYGQSAEGVAPAGAQPCTTPKGAAVTGSASDPRRKALVPPQCVDRAADRAVYCSCRCANDAGRTDDGGTYCGCSIGFECANVVASIGASTKDTAGSYCVKMGTVYDPDTACNQGDCDPVAKKCGP